MLLFSSEGRQALSAMMQGNRHHSSSYVPAEQQQQRSRHESGGGFSSPNNGGRERDTTMRRDSQGQENFGELMVMQYHNHNNLSEKFSSGCLIHIKNYFICTLYCVLFL